jgi:hypothetical protein
VATDGLIGGDTSPETAFILCVAAVVALVPDMFGLKEQPKKKQRIYYAPIAQTTPRTRQDIDNIMSELGETFTRRAYRMSRKSFWKLLGILHPQLELQSTGPDKKTRKGARNGLINHAVRLSIALRYFAGGSPVDIAITHGVSHTAVFESVWEVVDAVNKCDTLKFQFPNDHTQQHELANGFTRLSKAGFNTCVAAINGIMIWINQPTQADCAKNNFSGPKKFFCGRKSKFGLNMQGVCDSKCRFVDIHVKQPGATSDYLAFNCMELKGLLEQPGFLAPGLFLFGDNAYMNTTYMATPYKGFVSDSKDTYNFFHSQLRITIERTFCMFVHRRVHDGSIEIP